MKVTFKTAIVCALIWIGFKMLSFGVGWNVPSNTALFVMTNMLLLLAAVAIGLYLQKRKGVEDDNILTDIKNGMSAGVIYSMIISAFLYFYYEKIDPDYNRKMVAEREAYFQSVIDNPVELKKIKANNKNLEIMSREEILQEFRKTPQMLFSGGFIMTYGVLAMLMLSTFYSVITAIIFRKVLFK